MEYCRPPMGLSFVGNVADNWRKFKQQFCIYMTAAGNEEKKSEVKVAMLLNAIGEEGIEIFNTFDLSDEDKQDYEKVIEAFELYATPKKNVVVERFIFNNRVQGQGENFESFYTDLRKLVKSCEFGDQVDSVVRDRIVLGIAHRGLQERLLQEGELSLFRAAELCRSAELSRTQAQTIQAKNVDTMKRFSLRSSRNQEKDYNTQQSSADARPSNNEFSSESGCVTFQCKKCNRKHKRSECPAYGKHCYRCGNLNHFSSVCKSRNIREISYSEPESSTNERQDNNTDIYVESVTVCQIGNVDYLPTEWTKNICICDKEISFKLDTGAQISVLQEDIFLSIGKNLKYDKTSIVLEAYGGQRFKPLGEIKLLCFVGDKQAIIDFVIVNNRSKPLLGLDGCIKLNLLKIVEDNFKRYDNLNCEKIMSCDVKPVKLHEGLNSASYGNDVEEFIRRNSNVFEGVGKFGKCSIKLKENYSPIARPPRRVPTSLRPKLEMKLIELENQNIIEKVENPQDWVSNLVIIEKSDGSLRLCMDPQDLNRAIKRDYALIPTVEELVTKLCNKTVFSVLDLKDGFFQMELDTKSSDLCTFNTPFGCYKFLRLPMGLSCAPEIFQKTNEKNFGDIPGVLIYFDDLLIAGDSLAEHDAILAKVIKRAQELNVKFNKNKIQYRVSKVKYLGYVFGLEGMKPDPDYVKAVVDMPEPTNKKELQRILGMINYLRQFIPQVSTLTAPLRELLKQDTNWQWFPAHAAALSKLKEKIVSAPVLSIFDSSKSIVIQADSSKDGLGCCLLQEGRPVAFASRSLTNAEKGYAQIEKEFLSIVFATNKFHYLIYGRPVEVLTDHKPLVSIMSKNVAHVMSPRLQRMKIKLLRYQLNLKYLPGKNMYIADLLSRSFLSEPVADDSEMTELVHCLKKYVQVSPDKQKEFVAATLNDEGLSHVLRFWVEGWPESKVQVPDEARDYFKCRNEICVDGGLIFMNDRVIVPKCLRNEMLNVIHTAHCGIEKAKARARQVIFWPGINKDIEVMISKCENCDMYKSKNVKEPLLSHEVPNLPYEKIGMDICEYGGVNYLVVGCYFSKWLDIIRLSNKTANEIIQN
ncbi:uncharacterized protein K02A2.6-like [Uloborus diversus]|uniref:uncharacterized protein K02A2.6-like n=1 Tax=Uloborus diversus TaxID=327109 RepID=UPI00240A89C9|nr:uncharacterized protein K02A2.6-like [Uloborus diversus]